MEGKNKIVLYRKRFQELTYRNTESGKQNAALQMQIQSRDLNTLFNLKICNYLASKILLPLFSYVYYLRFSDI